MRIAISASSFALIDALRQRGRVFVYLCAKAGRNGIPIQGRRCFMANGRFLQGVLVAEKREHLTEKQSGYHPGSFSVAQFPSDHVPINIVMKRSAAGESVPPRRRTMPIVREM